MSIATRIQAMEEHISDAYDSLSKFGVAAPSNKNIENIANLVNEIYDNTPKTDYASGTDLTIEDTRVGKIDFKDTDNIEKIGLGATNQIITNGNNLLNIYARHPAGYTETVSGVTFTYNDDGSINAKGTATADIAYFIASQGQLGNDIFNGTNYLSGCTEGSLTTFFLQFWVDTIGRFQNVTTEVTTNKTAGVNWNITIVIKNGVAIDKTFYPMMCAISGKTFEMYTNGASPNPNYPQDVNVVTGNQNISISNKNLFKLNNKSALSWGINYEINNSQILLNGTTNGKLVNIYKDTTNYLTLKAGTYRISSSVLSGDYNLSGDVAIYLRNISDNTALFTITKSQNYTSNISITLTQDTDIYLQIFTNVTDNTFNNFILAFQIEVGNTVTSYVAHQGNNFEVNLGKNLIEDETFVQGSALDNTAPTRISCRNIKLKANTTYTLSSDLNYSNFNIAITYASSEYPLPSGTSTIYDSGWKTASVTFTTGDSNVYSNIIIRKSNNANLTPSDVSGNHFQLEEGSATSYAPYFPPIELCKINTYQDYIYKNGKNWYLHKEIGKKIVDESTSITGYTTNVSGHYRYGINISDIKILTDGRAIPDLYCSHYKGQMVGNDGSWGAHQGIAIDNTHQRIYINDDTYYTQDATAYKAWITDNNLTIYYPLATPVETPITNENLITQLDTWYNAQSVDDITYITVDGDLPIQLKLRALKK